jgi:pimeloyl-ACP methyl ester carboxylesterase
MNELVPPEQVRFSASGMNFGALAWGQADAPLVLCLHGYPDTAWTWRFLGPYLADRGRRVVAPFMRGYAPTDLAPDGAYQLGALARDAIGAHAALGGDERTILVGHDWGAAAAYCAASHSPQRFRRVVALAVPPLRPVLARWRSPRALIGDLPAVFRQLRLSWYMLFQQLPGRSERKLDQLIPRLWADWSPGFDARRDLEYVFEALTGPGRRTAALRYYRALAQPWYRSAAYASEQAHWMGMPTQPVLLLHGRDDGCIQPVFAKRARDSLPPGSGVEVVPDVGHFMQLERPDVINDLIGRFIQRDVTPFRR